MRKIGDIDSYGRFFAAALDSQDVLLIRIISFSMLTRISHEHGVVSGLFLAHIQHVEN